MGKLILAVLLGIVLQGCANYDWRFNQHYAHKEINNA